jgi:hypothetical protein
MQWQFVSGGIHLAGSLSLGLYRQGLFQSWLLAAAPRDSLELAETASSCGLVRSLAYASLGVGRCDVIVWQEPASRHRATFVVGDNVGATSLGNGCMSHREKLPLRGTHGKWLTFSRIAGAGNWRYDYFVSELHLGGQQC